MIVSMTGFGKGKAEVNSYRASVEVRSVNGRFGEVSVSLPRALSELEPRIKEMALSLFSRGRIDVSVSVKGEGSGQSMPVLNVAVLDAYREGLEMLRARLHLAGDINPASVATLPNVFGFETEVPDLEAIWESVEPACREALADCQAMRHSEGERLAKELAGRVRKLGELLQRVEELAPGRVDAVRRKLEEKLREFLAPEQVDPNRLLTEIALLAERSDVTEETVRFQSHNAQFLQTIDRDEAVGRRLNFLLQEMLREANTIGSKAGDVEIAHLVVEMKEEIEKLREQVQNVE